ncbi:MAG: damage-inducible protein [Rhodospirillales bacterium]|nr:damage-inducible protein [Rhodospirillales bacterium]
MPIPPPPSLGELRARISRIGRACGACPAPAVALGIAAIDGQLPGGGLAAGALHEVVGAGPDVEHGAAAALFAAWVLARTHGPVLWVSARPDLFAPGLAAAGLDAGRVVHVEAGKAVLAAMEEGLRLGCAGGVAGEVEGRFGLTPSRRLQLAAEAAGVIALAIRRGRSADDPALTAPSAAVTRWRIGCLPTAPPLPHAPAIPGLGPARWRLDLLRVRGGDPSLWIVEAGNAPDHLRLAAGLGDGSAAAGQPGQRAAG